MWPLVEFGKYQTEGLSLPQLLLRDPDYFFWQDRTHNFRKRGVLTYAKLLVGRARSIKIPKPDPDRWGMKYHFDGDDFEGFSIVEQPVQGVGLLPHHLDLAVVHMHRRNDLYGNAALLRDFKFHYFGKHPHQSPVELDKDEIETFFDNEENFYGGYGEGVSGSYFEPFEIASV